VGIEKRILSASVLAFLTLLTSVAIARHQGGGNAGGGAGNGGTGGTPECLDHGSVLNIDNNTVLHWETSTANQFTARAHIAGMVDQIFPDHSGHRHFSVQIGSGPQDRIEVIYNLSFGALPGPNVGDQAEACGDYITSNAPSGGYPASPDGALLHWVHKSTSAHDGGFVTINGALYGQGNGTGN